MAIGPHDLRRARLDAGLTQAEVAERLGTTQSAVARWERGAVTPSLAAAARFAEAVGAEPSSNPTNERGSRPCSTRPPSSALPS